MQTRSLSRLLMIVSTPIVDFPVWPSPIERTVPTSDRSAPRSSSPSIRLLRMLVISSGLIFIRRSLSLSSGRSHLSSQFLQAAPDRPVHDHVPDLDCEPADHVGIDD